MRAACEAAASAAGGADAGDDERSGRYTNLSAEIQSSVESNRHRPLLSVVNVVTLVALIIHLLFLLY